MTIERDTRFFLQQNIDENRRQVEENMFPTDRGLRRKSRLGNTSYLSYRGFGPALRHELLKLSENELWIDIGGGELFAPKEYFANFQTNNRSRVGVVSVADPQTDNFKYNLNLLTTQFSKRFFYLSGQRIEDIPPDKLHKANLVSDLFGALTFTEHIDLTLARELAMLNPGGKLIARLQKAYIRDENGSRVGVRRYLNWIKGARLDFYGWYALVMTKTEEQVYCPPLELTRLLSYKNAPNPNKLNSQYVFCERYYRLIK